MVSEWGVRRSDGTVQAFRYKEAAVEHLALRKKFRYIGDQLVSRRVTYSDWTPDQSVAEPGCSCGVRWGTDEGPCVCEPRDDLN